MSNREINHEANCRGLNGPSEDRESLTHHELLSRTNERHGMTCLNVDCWKQASVTRSSLSRISCRSFSLCRIYGLIKSYFPSGPLLVHVIRRSSRTHINVHSAGFQTLPSQAMSKIALAAQRAGVCEAPPVHLNTPLESPPDPCAQKLLIL